MKRRRSKNVGSCVTNTDGKKKVDLFSEISVCTKQAKDFTVPVCTAKMETFYMENSLVKENLCLYENNKNN